MSPDERQAWEDDERVPSDFTGVHPVKLAPDAEPSARRPQRARAKAYAAAFEAMLEQTRLRGGVGLMAEDLAEGAMAVADAEQAVLVRERDEALADAADEAVGPGRQGRVATGLLRSAALTDAPTEQTKDGE